MENIPPQEPRVLVLADGDSPAAVANARGHLFEEFTGRIMERYGFQEPRRDRLNVTANGIELDLSVRHRLTRQPALVECKAYSSPVRAHMLSSFYGKLIVQRFNEPETHGFFVALPRLVPEGQEQARAIASSDTKFTGSAPRNVESASQLCGPVSLPRDTAAQQPPYR